MAKDKNGKVPKGNLFQRKDRYLVSGMLNRYMSQVMIFLKAYYIGVLRPRIWIWKRSGMGRSES